MYNEIQLLDHTHQKIDPRFFANVLNMINNFLLPKDLSKLYKDFKNQVFQIQQEILSQLDDSQLIPLQISSQTGDYCFVEYFMSFGGDMKKQVEKQKSDVVDKSQNHLIRKALSDLKSAAKNGDSKTFNILLSCGNQINQKSSIFGTAPIHDSVLRSSKAQDPSILDLILRCGASVDQPDSNGKTSLHHACELGDLKAVGLLLRDGADVFKYSNKGCYPIHLAAMNNHYEIIKYLNKHVEEEFQKTENYTKTHEESDKRGMLEAQKKHFLGLADNEKQTALHYACKKGHLQSVQTLLELGADLYAQDMYKKTALHHAAFMGFPTIIKDLCIFDADSEKLRKMKNSKGNTADQLNGSEVIKSAFRNLFYVCNTGQLEQARQLVMKGEIIDQRTRKLKQTPLILATKNQHLLIVKYLIEQGADQKLTDIDNQTARDYAIQAEKSIKKSNDNTKIINSRKIIQLFKV